VASANPSLYILLAMLSDVFATDRALKTQTFRVQMTINARVVERADGEAVMPRCETMRDDANDDQLICCWWWLECRHHWQR